MKRRLINIRDANIKNNSYVGADDSVRPIPKRNTQKGITLVALVITIIVLLILAMISVKIAYDGGLIEKSNEAVTIHEKAKTKESVQLAVAQCYMTKEGLTAGNLKKALKENGIEESKIGNIDITTGKVAIDGKEYSLKENNEDNKWYELSKNEEKAILTLTNTTDGEKWVDLATANDDNGTTKKLISLVLGKNNKIAIIIIGDAQSGGYVTFATDEAYNLTDMNCKIKETYNWYSSSIGEGIEQTEIYKENSLIEIEDFKNIPEGCEEIIQRIIENFNK